MRWQDIKNFTIDEMTIHVNYFTVPRHEWPDIILISDFVPWHKIIEPKLYEVFGDERAVRFIWHKDIAGYVNTKIMQDSAN